MQSGQYLYGYEELEPGVIDQAAIDVFTMGQCHALALELHEVTGWPLIGLFNNKDEVEAGETPYHTCVLAPEGIVDIEGIGADCRMMKRRRETYVSKLTVEGVLEFENIDYSEPDLEVAKYFVEPVMSKVSEQIHKGETRVCSSLPLTLRNSRER